MSAVEIFYEQRNLTPEELEERNAEKIELGSDPPLIDDVRYLIDINLYLDPNVPLNRLGAVSKAIGVELRQRPVVEDAADSRNGVPYTILVMALDFCGVPDLCDDTIKKVAHAMAQELIRPLEQADRDEPIEFPYLSEGDEFGLYLARNATNKAPEESHNEFTSEEELPFDVAPFEDPWSSED
ncbi:uncharacterized protein KD926_006400 [Aspergillus affinis]|uniref:uncharacterized protein n=1 Tax=Aspergillus affinis TaxID=1070780 RepID=UPI0022FEA446|nr:uncharacterized protein KD926_006400 [Aspergillus affinis]KAI9041855.1 hypothetical protein KD926_006400 [Aspergillus affinis]